MKIRKEINLKAIFIFSILCFATISISSGKALSAGPLVAEAGPDQETEVNQTLNFDGSASGGTIVSCSWDFGDGSNAYVVNPAHTYTSIGAYTVTLTVSDGIGESTDTLTVIVENLSPPSAPIMLEGLGGDNSAALSWDENPEADLAGYNVYRSATPGGPYDKITAGVVTANSYNDIGVTNGTPYYYVVTAVDISSYESGYSNETDVTPAYSGPTYVGGTITGDTVWTLTGSPYIVTNNITVTSGITLTVEPGTVVKFMSGFSLDVQGMLIAEGTEANPITFTSNAATPQKSDWGGISYTYNAGESFVMDWIIVEYGSYGIKYNADAGVLSPSITNSIVRNTGGDGIYIYGSGTADLAVTLSNNQVYDNDGAGIYCYAYGTTVSLDSTLSNNEVYNNGSYGIHLNTPNATYSLLIEGNTVYGNGSGGIYSHNTLPFGSSSSSSFTARDNTVYDNTGLGIWWDPSFGTLTGMIDNNTVYNSGVGIYVRYGGTTTASLEIVNNEVYDGSYGIQWEGNMTPVVSNNKVYGNTNDGIRGGALATPQISHNKVYNNTGYGIYISNNTGIPFINYNNIYGNADSAIYNFPPNPVDGRLNWWGDTTTAEMDAGGNPKNIEAIYDFHDDGAKGVVDYDRWLPAELSITDDPLSHIIDPLNGDAVKPGPYTIKGVASAGAGIEKVEVSVDGGTTWHTATGTYAWSYSWDIPGDGTYTIKSRVTDKNGVVETPGAGVSLTVDNALPTTAGSLTNDETWSGIVNLTGDITVPAGITLTLETGTVIAFPVLHDKTFGGEDPSRAELIVEGSLIAIGTETDPIKFTSNAKNKSDWGGISYTYSAGGNFAVDWIIVEYGSYGIKYSADGGSLSPVITNSIVHHTGGDGIFIYGRGSPDLTLTLSNNQVYDNDGNGIYCYVYGTSVSLFSTVSNNEVYNNGSYGIHYNTANATYSSLIEGNTVYGNGSYGIYSFNSSPLYSSSFIARDNIVYDNTGYGIFWYLFSGTRTLTGVIDNNTVYNSGVGICVRNNAATISSLEIVNNEVSNGSFGIQWTGAMTPVVSNNKVYGNASDGIRGGIFSTPQISHNEVYNNGDNGIHINTTTGISFINYNNIYGNTEHAIYNFSPNPVDARLNWWGDTTTAEMDAGVNPKDIGAIYDIYDDGAKGVVEYAGWLPAELIKTDDPLSHITKPLNGDAVKPGPYTIKGVASAGAGIEKVEVSVDGGTTWYTATGTYAWSYSWDIPGDGTYTIKSRVTDKDGAVETPGAGVSLTVDSVLPTTSGSLTNDETWSGIVNLTGDITVPAGTTLTLEPGTVIEFLALRDETYGGENPSRAELIVEGALIAIGTETDPITFTSDAKQKSDWGGINFTYNGENTLSLDYVIVEYSKYGIKYSSDTGSSYAAIKNSIIRYTGGNGVEIKAGIHTSVFIDIINNTIQYNDGYGIYCHSTATSTLTPTIKFNTLTQNSHGVYLSLVSNPDIKNNNIYDNTTCGLYNANSVDRITARINWWGDVSGPSGTCPGSGDAINYGVKADPWLGQAFTQPFNFSDATALPTEFSQNSGRTTFTAALTEEADWTITILDSIDQAVRNFSGTGDSIDQEWNGDDSSSNPLSDGDYTYRIEATSTGTNDVAALVIGTLQLDGNIPEADITSPGQNEIIAEGSIVSIVGTAYAANFSSYDVEYGEEEYPYTWTPLASGNSAVIDGTLATLNTSGFANPYYAVKLTVEDTEGNVATDTVTLRLFYIYNVSDSPDSFSPNEDGIKESTTINAKMPMTGEWTITIKDSLDATVRTYQGSGSSVSQVWDGKDELSSTVPDGIYTYNISAVEPSTGATPTPATGTVEVDTGYPAAGITSPATGDTITESIDLEIIGTASDTGIVSYRVEYGEGATPTSWTLILSSSGDITNGTLATWETLDMDNGDYTVRLTVTDTAGNESTDSVFITLDSIKIIDVTETQTSINPGTGETSGISYNLDRDSDVTIRIYDKNDFLVRTLIENAPQSQGINTVAWDGRDDFGTVLPYEAYTYTIEAVDVISGRSGIYDPEYVPGEVEIENAVINPVFDPYKGEAAEIAYGLVAPARVTFKVGIAGGANAVRTLTTEEPRDITGNVELWDGQDDNGNVVDPATYKVAAWTTILQENTIITANKTLKVTALSAETYLIIPTYNEVSNINYTISGDAGVTMKIYDPNGSYLRPLISGESKTAGSYTVQWDGTDDSGRMVSTEGDYSIEVTLTDSTGNIAMTRKGSIAVYK